MKKIFHFTVAIALLTLLPLSVNAQCKGFAKKICKVERPILNSGSLIQTGTCCTRTRIMNMP